MDGIDTPTPTPLPPELFELGAQRLAALRESAASTTHPLDEHTRVPGDPQRVLACSDYVFNVCARAPALLGELISSGELDRDRGPDVSAEYHAWLEPEIRACGSLDELMSVVRRLRHREMARIAWRDISSSATLDQVLAETSTLADTIVDLCTRQLFDWQAEKYGVPHGRESEEPLSLIVIALGKLGAGELNFSSDIDLIFAYAESGETRDGPRSIDNERFFIQLGRALIQVLGESTPDGFVYRVDMRLRPFGSQGPIALSFSAIEDYYQTHGRDWERYALIRARVISGHPAHGDRLSKALEPFVYRRYLDFGTLESLRDMKAMIEDEVARKGLENNVKLGPGGIREIEFTGQAFQMVRGGRMLALRDRRILKVLSTLGEHALLPDYAVANLTGAYRFLRRSENRLQQYADQQVHLLPDDEAGRARLAAGMGFADWQTYRSVLDAHRENVREQFLQVFGTADAEETEDIDPISTLCDPRTSESRARSLLADAGFVDIDAAWSCIESFRAALVQRGLDRHGELRLARLLPDLMRAISSQRDAITTLNRVVDVLGAIVRRSVYLALLVERPLALSQFVKLCAASPWIARLLARHPILLDELLDPRTLYAPLTRADLREDIAARLEAVTSGDTEQEMEVLRQFKQANVLKVAAADVTDRIPLMVVSDHLTEIAECVLETVLALARRDVERRFGPPVSAEDGTATAPFAIIAYGKLGGLELGYGSDLDLVFIHGGTSGAMTAGPKVVDHATYFGRLCQRIIHYLSAMTPQGVLYEVDPRLRPDGAKGVLATSIDGLRDYLHDKAWTWEHQALVRARIACADESLARRFRNLRREILLAERDPESLRAEVRDMRAKMRAQLGSSRSEEFDLKQDAGGVADIEFMVQYGALAWASRLGDYLDFTDNIRLLEGMGRAGLLPGSDVAVLTDAYRLYRTRQHELALQEASTRIDAAEFAEQREAVQAIWKRLMES